MLSQAERICAFADVPYDLACLVVQVADEHGIDVKSVRSDATHHHFVDCRRDIARRAKLLHYSYPVIGRALNRDHTSIIHLVKFTPNREALAA